MIKNWIIRKAMKWISREEMFRTLFCPTDQVAIINALWLRSKDESDIETIVLERQNEEIKSACKRLAKELGGYRS